MESTYNYIKGLKVEPNGAGLYAISFGPLKNVYTKFRVVKCDENGVTDDNDNGEEYSLEYLKSNQYKIIIKASEEANTYYKIIPYIDNGVEEIPIQENDAEKGNIVKIPMIQYTIYWSFEPFKKQNNKKFNIFKKDVKITNAKLMLNCGKDADINPGDLCYKINGLYYPLPSFNQSLCVDIPGEVESVEVVAATDNAASKFRIERRQDNY